MRRLILVAVAAANWGMPATAEELPKQLSTADDYVHLCTLTDATAVIACNALTRGMSDGLRLGAAITNSQNGKGFDNLLFCVPGGRPESIDERAIMIAYVKAHPAEGKALLVGTFFKALADKYPCLKK